MSQVRTALGIAGLLSLGVAGCATTGGGYSPPQASEPSASIQFEKPPGFSMLYDVAEVHAYENERCDPTASSGELVSIYYSTPKPVSVRAGVPLFLRMSTVRHGGLANYACLNVVSFSPDAGQRYTLAHRYDGGLCRVVLSNSAGMEPDDFTPHPIQDTCLGVLKTWKPVN